MNKKDLKNGEIYVYQERFINLIDIDPTFMTNIKCYIILDSGQYCNTRSNNGTENIRLATPEEKHWLNKCIELNRSIKKEDALKDFIPELPKRWYIKNNSDIEDDLIKWRGAAYYDPFKKGVVLISDKMWFYPSELNKELYTEITFDQFKKYVLKKDIKEKIINSKSYSIKQIEEILLKNYDKDDIFDIINTIKSINS